MKVEPHFGTAMQGVLRGLLFLAAGLADFLLAVVVIVLWGGSIGMLLSGSWWAVVLIAAAGASTWAFIRLTRRIWPRWISRSHLPAEAQLPTETRDAPIRVEEVPGPREPGSLTTDSRPRRLRDSLAAITECAAGVMVVVAGLATPQVEGSQGWLNLTLGVLIVLSGIGFYRQIEFARFTSGLYAVLAILLGVLAAALGEGTSLVGYLAYGLVFLSGVLILLALGLLGPLIDFFSS